MCDPHGAVSEGRGVAKPLPAPPRAAAWTPISAPPSLQPQGAPSPPCSAVTPGCGSGSPLWGDSALTPQQHHVKALGGGCLPFPSVSSLPSLPFAPTANIFQLPPLPQSGAIKEPTKQQQLRPVRTELPSLAQRCCGEAGGCCAPPPLPLPPPGKGGPVGMGGMGSMWRQPELLLVGVREGKLRHREQLGAAVLPALCWGVGGGGWGLKGGDLMVSPPAPLCPATGS